jgi:hypothetical protein
MGIGNGLALPLNAYFLPVNLFLATDFVAIDR